MKVRNLPYDELNEKEQVVVQTHYKGQLDDEDSDCRNQKCKNSIQDFWETHRETDTDNGLYDGWIDPFLEHETEHEPSPLIHN